MTVGVASTISFSMDGIFLTRSWWKPDCCHWMCSAVLTWGCYSPGRSIRKVRRIQLCSFYDTWMLHSQLEPFLLWGLWGAPRERNRKPTSQLVLWAVGVGCRGQGSSSVPGKVPCCIVNGTVFFSIDEHSKVFFLSYLHTALLSFQTSVF